jgi:hypothetical protein
MDTCNFICNFVSELRPLRDLFFFPQMRHQYEGGATDRGKPKNSEAKAFQCHFIHHKSHTDWPGLETGPPCDWLIMMGWDYVSEQWPPTGLFFISQVICERREPWWWWCRLGITPDSSTRALLQFYQQRHLGQIGRMDEGVRILPISIWHTSRDV